VTAIIAGAIAAAGLAVGALLARLAGTAEDEG
jgi:hypothetical protein